MRHHARLGLYFLKNKKQTKQKQNKKKKKKKKPPLPKATWRGKVGFSESIAIKQNIWTSQTDFNRGIKKQNLEQSLGFKNPVTIIYQLGGNYQKEVIDPQ